MKKLFFALLLATATIVSSCSKEYSFEVTKNISDVFIKQDGSIDIEYAITFCNKGRTIDVVDIGFPHAFYNLRSVEAEVDGVKITDIRKSEYIPVGVEIHLGSKSIQKGQTSTLRVKGNNPMMVFPDTTDPRYASVEFSPTWFAPEFVSGKTYLEVNLHLPAGVGATEPRWHISAPTKITTDRENRITYKWVYDNARQQQYLVGASFPRKYIPEKSICSEKTIFDFANMNRAKPSSRCGFFGAYWFVILFAVLSLGIRLLGVIVSRGKRMRYFAPEVSIEGLGVHKGLAPAEAAVVMELPLNRIAAIILHGLVEKGIIRVEQIHPLRVVRLVNDLPPLANYEKDVLEAVESSESGKARERLLSDAMVKLVKSTGDKIRGYDRRATRTYYKEKVEKALENVERDASHLTWLMLDEKLPEKIEENPQKGQVLDSVWRERYHREGYFYYPFPSWRQYNDFCRSWIPDNRKFTERVTRVTNPAAFIPSGGGSHGGFCACACAGCACACAGGGR